jgi:hypothetical protein
MLDLSEHSLKTAPTLHSLVSIPLSELQEFFLKAKFSDSFRHVLVANNGLWPKLRRLHLIFNFFYTVPVSPLAPFITSLASKWPSLIELSLEKFRRNHPHGIGPSEVTAISQGFPSLASLSLRDSDVLPNALPSITATAFPHLQHVDFTEEYSSSMPEELIGFVDRMGSQLLTLKLDNRLVKRHNDPPDWADRLIEKIIAKCDYIQTLHIANGFGVSEACLVSLIETCHRLTSIDLSGPAPDFGCRPNKVKTSDKVLFAIAENLPDLKEAFLSHTQVTDAGVQRLVGACRSLQRLDIKGTKCKDSQTLVAIYTFCKDLRFFRSSFDMKMPAGQEFRRKMSFCEIQISK